jgi:hypothetical protein
MRFCPFCAQENSDDSRECAHCGKRLPAARTPPPKPAAPPREKPAPKVAARPAPRSLPLKPPATVEPAAVAPAVAAPEPPKPAPLHTPTPAPPPLHTPTPPVMNSQMSVDPPTVPTPAPPVIYSPTPLPPPVAAGPDPLPPPPSPKAPANSATLPATTGTVLGMGALRPADSERRSTKPLPLKALEVPASRADASLPGTKDPLRLDGSDSDEATTTPNPRVDNDLGADDGATRPEMPNLFSMAENAQGRGPRDDSLTLPKPRKAVVTRLDGAKRPGAPAPPVRPLPKEPEGQGKIDPIDDKPSITYSPSGESAPPILDSSHTPFMPTLALPPMPAGPQASSIPGSVKYLLPLARAVLARKRAQRSIRQLLHSDQHLLDGVLKDLGKAARENDLDVPAITDEMRRVKAEEQRRAKGDADISKAADEMGREDARWNVDEAERKSEIARREAELKETEDELRAKGDERRSHETERARIDGQIRAAEKRSAQASSQAQKAEITPPEKGGGPNTAANLRMQAQEAQKEATSLIAPRDEAKAQAEALDAPIHTLTQKIVDQRAQLAQKRKELADALANHKKARAALEAEQQRATKDRSDAEREMSQRFVNVGTMLNLNRVEDSKYKSLYEKIDELKSGLNAREATIVRLETELRTYDRRAVQTGLITVGVIFSLVVLLAILLAVVLSR